MIAGEEYSRGPTPRTSVSPPSGSDEVVGVVDEDEGLRLRSAPAAG